jgi:glyoxylase-like metal-dependent hydrolase (beta-lactamase superfamily II)
MISKRVVWMCLLPALLAAGCSAGVDLDRTGLVKLSGNTYAFIASGPSSAEGLGANAGFVVGEEKILVIDSRFTPALAEELAEAIRSVSQLPIAYLVNTHYHPDHVWGNSVFREMGALILATEETRIEIERYTPVYLEYYRNQKPDVYRMLENVEAALPDSVVGRELKLDLGGVEVLLEWFGPAHTSGDIVVSVPSEGIVFTGGLVSNGYHPNLGDQWMDSDNWLKILSRIEEKEPKIVVPGQGKASGGGILATQRDYIVSLVGSCLRAISERTPLSSAVTGITVPGAEAYDHPNILPFNIQAIYRERVLETVSPAFGIDIPQGFSISDGGGNMQNGMIQWVSQTDDGFLELTIQWQPTGRQDLLIQDINDRIVQYHAMEGFYKFVPDGRKRVIVEGSEIPALYGEWLYRQETRMQGGGAWTWTMKLDGNILYSIRMLTNAAGDWEKQQSNMQLLEEIVSTMRWE